MSEEMWMVAVDGSQLEGEHNAEQVRALIARYPGRQLVVWNETMPEWADPRSLPAFRAPAPAPAPAAPPPMRPAPSPYGGGGGAAAAASRVAAAQARDAIQEDAKFFKGLLDFKFEVFITPKIVRVLYIISACLIALGLVIAVLMSLKTMFSGAGAMGMVMGLVMLALSPIAAILYLTFIRVFYEIALVFFKMKDGIEKIAAKS